MTSGSRTTPLECTLPMDKIPHQLISYLSYHSQCVCLKWGMMSSVFFPNCTYICMNTQYTYIIYYTHNIVSCVFCGRTSAQNLRKSTLTLVLYIFTKVMSCSGQNIEWICCTEPWIRRLTWQSLEPFLNWARLNKLCSCPVACCWSILICQWSMGLVNGKWHLYSSWRKGLLDGTSQPSVDLTIPGGMARKTDAAKRSTWSCNGHEKLVGQLGCIKISLVRVAGAKADDDDDDDGNLMPHQQRNDFPKFPQW